MANLFNLSTKSGMANVEVEYAVVKDYCEKFGFDEIDTFSIVKRVVSAVYRK